MVKKLFKYEIISYLRSLLPFEIILIAVACLTRFVAFFQTDHWIYGVLAGSTTSVFIIANVLLLVMTGITAITRFYKNLYSAEGYLSFTLPVTESQHIFVKLLTAMMFELIALVSCIVAVMIATAGELCGEIFNVVGYLFKELYKIVGVHLVFYIIEFIVATIAAAASGLLIYYSCISLGQLAKKNRVAAAFGVYMIYYVAFQVISTVFTIIVPFLPLESISTFIDEHIFGFIHSLFGIATLFSLGISVGLFFLNRFIMHKKLNLE